MKKNSDLVRIYTGPESTAILLKSQLESLGIYTLTKNDFTGAFMGVVQPSIDLWINAEDLEKAKSLIEDITGNELKESNEIPETDYKETPESGIPFRTIDWTTIPRTQHDGEYGIAFWQTVQYPGLRIRMVEYSKGYLADHWCKKGHIVHCLEGDFISEMESGEKYSLQPGMTYIVSDDLSSHKSYSENGVKLLIIDGDFLK